MDDGERAQGYAELQRKAALAQHKASQPTGPSLTHCEDCQEEIPAERRVNVPGCTRCVDCQMLLEDKLNYMR